MTALLPAAYLHHYTALLAWGVADGLWDGEPVPPVEITYHASAGASFAELLAEAERFGLAFYRGSWEVVAIRDDSAGLDVIVCGRPVGAHS